MSNFLLLNEAINSPSLEDFKLEFSEIILIKDSSNDTDNFWKHDSIWYSQWVSDLFADQSQEAIVIIKTLGQFSGIVGSITCLEEFDSVFPDECNAFLGFDFSDFNIPEICQIINVSCYFIFCQTCLPKLSFKNSDKLESILGKLFSGYAFSDEALEDILHWKKMDNENYLKVFRLLEDIKSNPFTGGLGQTEVLKNMDGVISKRINRAHRIIYSLKEDVISIIRCRGHYD